VRLSAQGIPRGVFLPIMGKLARAQDIPPVCKRDCVLFGTAVELRGVSDCTDYIGVLCLDRPEVGLDLPVPAVYGAPGLEYLEPEDVVLLNPSGKVNVLFRRRSENNTILTTERCNSYCLMCSQPPKEEDDSYRVSQILRLLELISPTARELGVSGGEPTLLGEDFLSIVRKAKCCLPSTALHVLTNGRKFNDEAFATRLGAVQHPDLMLGIPLYSDIDYLHDYVVQRAGAFDETIMGYYNLAQAGVRIELRVVLHAQTVRRLPRLAEYIARNLPFIEHVALMGLEMFGFTTINLPALWIDPIDYADELERATLTLAESGMNVSIYNHQLCTVRRSVWPFCRKSISDWKNVYLPQCQECGIKQYCGGFFQSATKRHSAHIVPQTQLDGCSDRWMMDLHGLGCAIEDISSAACVPQTSQ
jgi:His-Xaa-Ser system radical SAM maturase HxsC